MATTVHSATTQFSGTLSLGKRSPKSERKHVDSNNVTSLPRTPLQSGVAVGASKNTTAEQKRTIQPPPDALVKTWAWMWQNGPSPEVSREGRNRLILVFGSIEVAAAYISTLKE